jgi:hypothetical protein
VVLTLHVLWQIFCMFLVILHQLHAVSISVLLLISLTYLMSSHYALCQCISFSNHPLFPQYCYQICFSELKTTYIFNCINEEQVWQFKVHIYLYLCIYIYIYIISNVFILFHTYIIYIIYDIYIYNIFF